MAITGAIKGSSRECLYRELGLESLRDRRWYRRLVSFYNINSGNSPDYLKSLIPENQYSYNEARSVLFKNFRTRSDYFKNSFFPYCVNEWNKLAQGLKNSQTVLKFKRTSCFYTAKNESCV